MERVGAVLRDLGEGDTLLRRLAHARALERWPELVGPHLARCTRALRVADGRLVVLAPGAALRQELTYHKRTILRKFNEAAGGKAARDVVFLESDSLAWEGDASPARPEVRRKQPDPGPTGSVEDEDEQDPDEGPVEPIAVVRTFDAEAYRRRMEEIARGSDRPSQETR